MVRHSIEVVRELENAPVIVDRHKVAGLVNLLPNAKQAMGATGEGKRLGLASPSRKVSMRITVRDNGSGLRRKPDRIFGHGYHQGRRPRHGLHQRARGS